MKYRVGLLSAFLSISFNISAAEEFQPYIVNGSYASVTTYSSYVALFVDSIEYNNTYYSGSYCGGTILDSTHILTAAHCIYSSDHNSDLISLFTVVVPHLQYESYFPYSITEKQRVKKIYYPDSFNATTLNNDIAILELESMLETIGSGDYAIIPALNADTTYRDVNETFHAVGHGNTKTGSDDIDYLQYASLTYVDNSICDYSYMNDSKLCMKGTVTDGLEASTCNGDSGGPLYWYNSTEYVQVGVTSFGPATFCGDPSYSATSVFTEIYDYKAWISSVLADTETAKFMTTEALREAYVDGLGSDSSQSSVDTGGGGGSLGAIVLFLLGITAVVRQRQI